MMKKVKVSSKSRPKKSQYVWVKNRYRKQGSA